MFEVTRNAMWETAMTIMQASEDRKQGMVSTQEMMWVNDLQRGLFIGFTFLRDDYSHLYYVNTALRPDIDIMDQSVMEEKGIDNLFFAVHVRDVDPEMQEIYREQDEIKAKVETGRQV